MVYQRIYDLLVEAQINEVAVYRNTSFDPSIHPYLKPKDAAGKSQYGIRNTKGKLRNVDHPEIQASYERGSEIRKQKGLAPLPNPRARAKALMNKKFAAGQVEIRNKGLGSDNMLASVKSRGHGMKSS